MKQLLLIDDDPTTHKIVKGSVQDSLKIISCYSLTEANQTLDTIDTPAIILIDRMLPDGDGLSLCSRIRNDERLKAVPIIFLSSKDSESDKVSGLFAGADDYITKPFGVLELRARIQARLRTAPQKFFVGDLILDLEAFKVFIKSGAASIEVDLTRTEFKMLAVLSQSVDKVFSRESLLARVWGSNCHLSDRVIDTHISHLRQKLDGSGVALEAVRGEGYRLVTSKKPNHQATA